MWIGVGAILAHLGTDDEAAVHAAIEHARLAGWLSVGGTPPLSVLPKHGKLREITGTTEKKR